jgi:6-phosphofructo-2-kinase/fructose-2,6-biphosphatase
LGAPSPVALQKLPYMAVPLHTVIKLTLDGASVEMEQIRLGPDCVNTQREQPQNCEAGRGVRDACSTVPAHL